MELGTDNRMSHGGSRETGLLLGRDFLRFHDEDLDLALNVVTESELHRIKPKFLDRPFEVDVFGVDRQVARTQRLADFGQEIFPRDQQTPEALRTLHKAEIEKWWPIMKAAGIKAE